MSSMLGSSLIHPVSFFLSIAVSSGPSSLFKIAVYLVYTDSRTDPQTDRLTRADGPTERQTDRTTNRQADMPSARPPGPRPCRPIRYCFECSPACGECGLYKCRSEYKITDRREVRCLACSFPECEQCGFRLDPSEAKAVQERHKIGTGRKWFCGRSKTCRDVASAAKLAVARQKKN